MKIASVWMRIRCRRFGVNHTEIKMYLALKTLEAIDWIYYPRWMTSECIIGLIQILQIEGAVLDSDPQ